MPDRKVTVGALAGACTVVLMAILGAFGVEVTPEVASAATTIVTFALSYLVPNPSSPGGPEGQQ